MSALPTRFFVGPSIFSMQAMLRGFARFSRNIPALSGRP